MRDFKTLLLGLMILPISAQVWAAHSCSSPLILDLDDNGIATTSVLYGVSFDINGDGDLDRIAWTFWEGQDAFLWLDLNRNSSVDSGSEFFGDSTWLILDETYPRHGFAALAQYDEGRLGGNGDGMITDLDSVWDDLRLWIDEDQDGISQESETSMLSDSPVIALGLRYRRIQQYDGAGNLHGYRGWLEKRVVDPLSGSEPAYVVRRGIVDDVFFRVDEEEHH